MPPQSAAETRPRRGSAWEVFGVFSKLGVTSFGGPIAHLGYFRTEVVARRGWLADDEYAELVALSQFLPGPASSQVGFGIGMLRAGFRGALAAFLGFTLPSAIVMVLVAYGVAGLDHPLADGLLSGLKIVAVAIVAQAVAGMVRTLTPEPRRASIAVGAAVVCLVAPGSAGQLSAIGAGAIAGWWLCRDSDIPGPGGLRFPVSRSVAIGCLILFAALLVGLPLAVAATQQPDLAIFDAFYRAGSLVFGGGHVVLPLLQAGLVDPGWVSNQEFLAGYAAAQAVPGPLFTFAAFLGAVSMHGSGGVLGAVNALVAVFLPGFLLLTGVMPFWDQVRHRQWAQAAMRGTNAAVVGILAAALYNPVFTTAITSPAGFGLALAAFLLLVSWKLPPWIVVVLGALGGLLPGMVG